MVVAANVAHRGSAPAGPRRDPIRAAARWLEASVRVPLADAERVGAALIAAGSQGVVTAVHELARGARRRTHETVRGYFPADDPVRARLAVAAAMRAVDGAKRRPLAAQWRELDEQLWEIDWREHFQPVLAGRRLAVVPPWDRTAHADRVRVVIHPGMAFGTGQHETTLTCLEALEELASAQVSSALDVGTGTGVLAIALAKLGVRRVTAIDTDPQAIDAARANVRRNRLGRRITLSTTPLDARHPVRQTRRSRRTRTRHPIVVANLYVDVLVTLEPTLANHVAAGGFLVTSGVLRSQQGRVRRAFAAPAWRARRVRRRGQWVTTTFERSA